MGITDWTGVKQVWLSDVLTNVHHFLMRYGSVEVAQTLTSADDEAKARLVNGRCTDSKTRAFFLEVPEIRSSNPLNSTKRSRVFFVL